MAEKKRGCGLTGCLGCLGVSVAAIVSLLLLGMVIELSKPFVAAWQNGTTIQKEWGKYAAERARESQIRQAERAEREAERRAQAQAEREAAEQAAAAEAAKPERTGRGAGNSTGAYLASKEFAKRRLRSPSTAKFPGAWERSADGRHVNYIGGGIYHVDSWVEAQNGFGAVVRMRYAAVVRDDGGGYWSVLEFEIDAP